MNSEQSYFSPAGKASCRFSVQGSRFIATIAPAATEDMARSVRTAVEAAYPDATHHPYALRVGSGSNLLERSSDDREPAGTAGAPMLQVLQGKNISDAIVIGTRYFGGTKLGIGGLTRAYRQCARQGLEEAALIEKEPLEKYILKISYEDIGAVTRLLESINGTIVSATYGEKVALEATLPLRRGSSFRASFQEVCRGRGSCVRQ
jgi:uncharacterized YigZ family protein